jgi:predicted nucleic acid-binding protein
MKYIDTSAFVKHFGDPKVEKGSDKVSSIISQASRRDVTLISSFLMIGEAVSVFDKWVRRRYITRDELNKVISKFFSVNTLSVAFSIEYILKHNIPINDAIHLYTALVRKPSIEEFICSDKNLKKAAKEEGFKILDPEKTGDASTF